MCWFLNVARGSSSLSDKLYCMEQSGLLYLCMTGSLVAQKHSFAQTRVTISYTVCICTRVLFLLFSQLCQHKGHGKDLRNFWERVVYVKVHLSVYVSICWVNSRCCCCACNLMYRTIAYGYCVDMKQVVFVFCIDIGFASNKFF